MDTTIDQERKARAAAPDSNGRTAAETISGRAARWLFPAAAALCLTPWLTPPTALALGIALALTLGNPYAALTRSASKWLLQICVVALGFGMNLESVAEAGLHGLWFAAGGIAVTCAAGFLLGRWLGIDRKVAALVSVGTAICGGSAIAAAGSVMEADAGEMSVALGTVFMLNAVALYAFPPLGHLLGLNQDQFGTWAGVAIHDISSVVGAASHYGSRALQVATAVKLSRALWIVPVTIVISMAHRRSLAAAGQSPARRPRLPIPWFIGLFLVASLLRTLVPGVAQAAPAVTHVAEHGLTLTLFLIGGGLVRETLKSVGARPLLLGLVLWLGISAGTLPLVQHLAA